MNELWIAASAAQFQFRRIRVGASSGFSLYSAKIKLLAEKCIEP